MGALQATHWWFVARRKILGSIIDGLRLPTDAAILEAGCGPGGNFGLLTRYGRLAAFDMDAQTVADCRQAFGVECEQGRLPADHPFHDSHRFDLVVALDVIEHVDQDEQALCSLGSCLRDGGRLLVTVPAYPWLFSAHDRFHHHKRRYRLATLLARARAAGLQVERAGYFNTILFPLIAAARLASAMRGASARSDAGMPGRVVNTLLGKIFASEAWWLRYVRFPFGTSIFLVASARPTAARACAGGME